MGGEGEQREKFNTDISASLGSKGEEMEIILKYICKWIAIYFPAPIKIRVERRDRRFYESRNINNPKGGYHG